MFNLDRQWKIANKIGCGYALAIGIAVLGGVIGLVSSDIYQKQAQQQLELAEQQEDYLTQLEIVTLEVRFHPQQLILFLDDPVWLDYQTSVLINQTSQLRNTVLELGKFVAVYSEQAAVLSHLLSDLDKRYLAILERHTAFVENLRGQVNILNPKSADIAIDRAAIMNQITSDEFLEINLQFERLSEELVETRQAAKAQKTAASARLDQVEKMRVGIISGSLLLAVVFATLLALRTSRAIAQPIESLTTVAQAVTKTSDFNLRAPVTTQDEVGILANSLNQLIAWAGNYTEELEQTRDNLEYRTQELQDTLKNLQTTQAQLIQTEKMSSLGQMVAGVAHEINNPVSFIHGNLAHLEEYLEDLFALITVLRQHTPPGIPAVLDVFNETEFDFIQSDLPKLIQSMRIGSDRIKAIVLSLRNFSRLDEAEMKKVDLHEGLENTLIILNSRLKQGIEVIRNYGELPSILCYPAQLNQVFMNVIVNALDALETTAIEAPQITLTTSLLGSDRVVITIRDNGPGIPDHHKAKLFDPFFTTKPVGQGTGLGLSICYQIVEKHQGVIAVKSHPDSGSKFTITLPIEPQALAVAKT